MRLKEFLTTMFIRKDELPRNITREYIARWADKNNLVYRVAPRDLVSSTRFQEPNSDAVSLNDGIRAYYQALDKKMDSLKLTPTQRTAFLAAEAIGMNLAQDISFVAGNLALDTGNTEAYGVKDGKAYVTLDYKPQFQDRIRGGN